MDRASTFSNPGIIKRLQTEFIPVAGNVAELQWNRTPASKWFMDMAGKVNYRVRSGQTVQGFYVAGPDGKGYAFENIRDAKRVNQMLDESLDAYRADPPGRVDIPKSYIEAPFAKSPDATTSVVRVFTRIRPVPLGANPANNFVGRDHIWILGNEVKAILSSPTDGSSFALPRDLVGRIVRFHLIDNVRGEPDMWEPDQVKKANFYAKFIGVEGASRKYSFSGEFALKYADGKRGQDGTISGEITLNPLTNRVVRFRAYSQGYAWGESKYAGNAPDGRFPIVIAMVDTNDEISKNVPPEAIGYGNEYFHPKFAAGG